MLVLNAESKSNMFQVLPECYCACTETNAEVTFREPSPHSVHEVFLVGFFLFVNMSHFPVLEFISRLFFPVRALVSYLFFPWSFCQPSLFMSYVSFLLWLMGVVGKGERNTSRQILLFKKAVC